MAGTETGLKWLQRKARLVTGPERDEGIITQTDAGQDQSNATRLGHAFDSKELRDASWNQRLNAQAQYMDAKEEDERKAKGKKTGGAIKAKGWGKARGARAAKMY